MSLIGPTFTASRKSRYSGMTGIQDKSCGCRYGTFVVTHSGSNVMKWCVRFFPAVEALLSLPELWTPETARLEVDKCKGEQNIIPTAEDLGTNAADVYIPHPCSLTP